MASALSQLGRPSEGSQPIGPLRLVYPGPTHLATGVMRGSCSLKQGSL